MSISISLKQLETTILDAVPSFYPEIASLVMEYSHFPSTEGWITEWTGEMGCRIVKRYVMEGVAGTSAKRMPGFVTLVVDYCRKSEIFTRKHLEDMVGGNDALKRLLPEAGPQHQLPDNIDEWMQRDIRSIFSGEALNEGGSDEITAKKVTELYCLFWLPKGMSACLAEKIAKNAPKNRIEFSKDAWAEAIQKFGHIPVTEEGWILFPREMIGRANDLEGAQEYVPPGFEISSFCQTVYCSLMFFHQTGESILEVGNMAVCREEMVFNYPGSADFRPSVQRGQVGVVMRDDPSIDVSWSAPYDEVEGFAAVYLLKSDS